MENSMKQKLMGRKRGMMQRFDESGQVVACTVIEVEPNVITQIKTNETDGYQAVQIASGKRVVKDPRTMAKRVTKPLMGHFKKAGVEPRKRLFEMRLSENLDQFTLGSELTLSMFEGIEFVDVTATSRGKGFQGVMKRHNFRGGPASHGSGFHRHAGSTGMRSTPGRCLPGGKKAGRMGGEQVTVQSLRVVEMDAERNLLIVKGHVPGAPNGWVTFAPAEKKTHKKKG